MQELKRFSLLAVGLMLLFAASASAGDFAGSSVAFDLDVDIMDANEIMTNEGNADTSGLALSAGSGGRFEVEVFITPVPTTPLTSLALNFDIDTLVVELNRLVLTQVVWLHLLMC